MDYVLRFRRDVLAFEAAIRLAAAAETALLVPSCPGWAIGDLAMHLGGVHRYVAHVLRGRLQEPPDSTDLAILHLPADATGWPDPQHAPNRAPVPPGLADWFAQGAEELAALFASTPPGEPVWTWSAEQSAGFWLRMQAIEAAVHRWDAEHALGDTQPIDPDLAADAIAQTFEVMAPARRSLRQAPPGSGERIRLRRTDGPGTWTAHFDGPDVHLDARPDARPDGETGSCDVELAGPAEELMLFLWQRIPAARLETKGDQAVLDRYFTLVPPV
ncbi:uncharacterized protein (TIGR03083 family) [Kitasatospora sp. MAP12-15]|uniref:maleylpyruvate isomerase family mycothiol-dependent enzyme n=1 Tax=unclassified Kitasatospora TaxID=2633591 RepID=UPI0024745323|nr:maleylpyruvate isomerase family mycothiol-dependent enzyme [Kitasatospora sp. MAP12-44]MDH6108703.1 uncharacterized protein (TIGR03083 family) [Kitasatospora sp. MAP12-44]